MLKLRSNKVFYHAVFAGIVTIWLICWYMNTWRIFLIQVPYYKIALSDSQETLRSINARYDQSDEDYYQVLRISSEYIPENEKVSLVLPTDQMRRFEFLRDKGRYYLYPRNYGNNDDLAKYLLVYNVKDFTIPAHYAKVLEFAPNKYLLVSTLNSH